MMTIGRELQRRGHTVYLLGIPDVAHHASKGAVDFAAIGTAEFPPGALDSYLTLIRNVNLLTIRKGIDWAERMSRSLCRDATAAVESLGLDALLVDQCQTEGRTIADLTGVPYLSICNALNLEGDASGETPPPFLPWTPGEGRAVQRFRNRLGHQVFASMMAPIVTQTNKFRTTRRLPLLRNWEECISPLGTINNLTQGMDFPRGIQQRPMFYTGPYLDERPNEVPFPWEQLDGRPLIYASLGTLHTAKWHILEAIAHACANLPVQLVVSLGQWTQEDKTIALPGQPITVSYAPQLTLLARASVAITHAGANTVMEALAHGCPLVAIPLASDQPAIAARVTWAGAGVVVAPGQVTRKRLQRAISTVLEQTSMRMKAAALQQEILQAGGVMAAANVIETVLGDHLALRLNQQPN
ncbi:MAG: glycosyltransferase [Nostoc sp.]|uniref:glycosyltransferase n=1 Tax=Nostoc sp. TaxID=1180 RepID=UPI002FFB5F2A